MCRKNVSAERFVDALRSRNACGDVHQVIIVDPDEIVGLGTAGDGIRVTFVNLFVSLPVRRLEIAEVLQIVKQRPDHLVGIAVVKFVALGFAQGHRHDIVTGVAGGFGQRSLGFCRRFPANQSTCHRARAAPAQLRKQVRLLPV